ncbi:zinc ribbon domain-containing protein [Promethearchaeum syntrophicum]|uniref:Zinc ribbon domain-containing protein n=1 Tax=Promethearchaeum syntrophicum TaxID=2594042 RepID=A0A5B9DBY8_9ARCH|nr:zinc ribbon domain-containing protein [Candidatus Prometheoarchaeum syntrophicum]QEE16270.1 hypothetical protein DSAG12_02100 [Candidatus Prometheoarchaeum syntrophicum]
MAEIITEGTLKNFKELFRNFKYLLNIILISNLFLFIMDLLYRIFNTEGYVVTANGFDFFIGCVVLIGFFLYIFHTKKILFYIRDLNLNEEFKSIKALNIILFLFFLLIYFPIFPFYHYIGAIILFFIYINKYLSLRKNETTKILQKNILIGPLFVVIGIIASWSLYFNLQLISVSIFAAFGMVLMNMKTYTYFYNRNSVLITSLEKFQRRLPQIVLYGQKNKNKNELVQEIKVEKEEFESESVKISKNSIQEEAVEQINESKNQPEIIIKEEIPKQQFESTIVKVETKPEIVNQPEFIFEADITQHKISRKPIQSNNLKKEDISHVFKKKKCPFCGKQHEDLNTPFCHACGYKF